VFAVENHIQITLNSIHSALYMYQQDRCTGIIPKTNII